MYVGFIGFRQRLGFRTVTGFILIGLLDSGFRLYASLVKEFGFSHPSQETILFRLDPPIW